MTKVNSVGEDLTKTVYEGTKPSYVFRGEYTTDNRVLWQIHPIAGQTDVYWSKAMGQRIEGKSVVVYAVHTSISRADMLRVMKYGLELYGIIES